MVRPRGVLIHLPEDCRGVVEHLGLPAEQPGTPVARYRVGEGKFCSRKHANRRFAIVGGSKPARAEPEALDA